MKKMIMGVILAVAMATAVAAHDEGHGPKLTDSGKYGGVIAPVIRVEEVSLGRKAKMVYKAELTRSQDGTIRVYLYDTQLTLLPITGFDTKASATLEAKKKRQWEKTPFTLKKEKDAFVGQMPVVSRKPFNIDVTIRQGEQSFLVAFDNLD